MLPLSLVLAVVGGCSKPKGVEVAAVDLVPDASQIALGFQVDPIKSSALSGPLWQAIESDPDMSGIANALPTCEIKTDGLKGLIAGNIDGDDMMIVIESPGVGNEKAMDCLEKELAKADGEEPGVVAFETHGKVRRAPQEAEAPRRARKDRICHVHARALPAPRPRLPAPLSAVASRNASSPGAPDCR